MGVGATAAAIALALWARGCPGASEPGAATERGARSAASVAAPVRIARGVRVPVPHADYMILAGRVITPDGAAVAGAEVEIHARPVLAPPAEPGALVATSDGAGAFAFAAQLTGAYRLEARAGDAVSAAATYHLRRGAPPVTLVLFPGATMEVEVVVAADGRPVPGAEVGVWAGDAEFGDAERWRVARAGADGVARFTGLVATSNHAVYARAPGFVDGYVNTIAAAQPERARWRARVELQPGAELAGRVVDAAGAPVEGALVGFDARRDEPLPDGIFSPFLRAGAVGTAVTDEAGAFRLTAEPGTGCAVATAPGYAMAERCGVAARPGGGATVELRLGDGAAITGRVVDAGGAPAAGATVLVTMRGEDIEPMFEGNYRYRTRADELGRFQLAGVDRVPVALYAYTDGASSDLIDLDLSGDQDAHGIELTLGFDGVITGVVVEPDGTPVPYAAVIHRPDSLSDDRGFETGAELEAHGGGVAPRWTMQRNKGAVRCDAAGQFTITGLAPGPYRLIADRAEPSSTTAAAGVVSERAVFTGSDATLVLPPIRAVRGRVVTAGGEPVRSFTVSLALGDLPLDARMFPPGRGFDAPDGRFELRRVPAGSYRLRVTGPGIEDTYLDPFTVGDGELDLGAIRVRRGVVRTAVVVDAAGAPVAGAQVVAAYDVFTIPLETGRDGRVTLPTVAADVALRARATTEDTASDWVQAGASERVVELRLRDEAPGAITGALVHPGEPIEGRVIAATAGAHTPDEEPPRAVATTTAGGLFELSPLPPGSYHLWVHRPERPLADYAEGESPWISYANAVTVRSNQATDLAVVLRP